MRPMIGFHGLALIAELVAAACLAIALAGFARWRDAPWLHDLSATVLLAWREAASTKPVAVATNYPIR